MTEAEITVHGRPVRYVVENDDRAEVDRADQIPSFPDEAAERAWWGEHTLSEAFWKHAEPVLEDELPPARSPVDHGDAVSPPTAGRLPGGITFAEDVVVVGAILIGIYLVYRLLKSGAPASELLPTRVPHLRIVA